MVSVVPVGTVDRIVARILFSMRRAGSGTRATYSSTVVGALLRFDAGRVADFAFFIRRCYFIPGARFERQRRSMPTSRVSFMTRPVVRVTPTCMHVTNEQRDRARRMEQSLRGQGHRPRDA